MLPPRWKDTPSTWGKQTRLAETEVQLTHQGVRSPRRSNLHRAKLSETPPVDQLGASGGRSAIERAAADQLCARLPSLGYLAGRVLADGSVAGIVQLLYTTAICTGCTGDGWARRFCFDDRAIAEERFLALSSEDDEPAGFIATRVSR